jgi:putative ribosome biogenesis GTPase RsgA
MYGTEMNYAVLAVCIKHPEIKADRLFRKLGLIEQASSNVTKAINKKQKAEINHIMVDLGITYDTIQYDLGLDSKNIESLTKSEANRIIRFYKPYCLM